MQLLKLELTNFKGAKSFCFAPDGNNASVYGDNGTGKTTLFDALTWLLYDKGSDHDGKNFSPKTTGADGAELHNLDNTVKGTFRLDDGAIITLTKTMSEDWTAKRGSTEKTFSGNKTAYAIDDVPCNQTEYKRRVETLCPSETAQILTRPLYFPSALPWQKRREILLEMCGDVSDADVIAANSELAELPDVLRKPGSDALYTVEEWRLIAAAKLKSANERMKEIPQRIDEASRNLPDVSGLDEKTLSEKRQEAVQEQTRLLDRRSALMASDGTQEIKKQLAAEQTASEQDRAEFLKNKNARLEAPRKQLHDVVQAQAGHVFGIKSANDDIAYSEKKLSDMRSLRERLSKTYNDLRISAYDGSDTCPTCGQHLPEDRIAAARESFNVSRAEKLEYTRNEIGETCSKVMIAEQEKIIEQRKADIEALEAELAELKNQETVQRAELAPLEAETYEDSPEYAAHIDRMTILKEQLSSGTKPPDELDKVNMALMDVQKQLDGLSTDTMNLKFYKQRTARISELEQEQRTVSEEYDRLAKGVYLCECFVKAKVSMLTERINSHFATVRFRLFEQQINGGVKECCEVMAQTSNGLKLFTEANDAAKLCAGLEIVDALSRYWCVSMPVFVDNAESVVQLPKIAPQVIRLVVSGKDTVLRVETEGAG